MLSLPPPRKDGRRRDRKDRMMKRRKASSSSSSIIGDAAERVGSIELGSFLRLAREEDGRTEAEAWANIRS